MTVRQIPSWAKCPRCGGSGAHHYSSTALWRGGVGGAMMTQGPCDQCWGSGSIDETWPNVKGLEDEVRALRAERARVAAELRSQIDRMRNSDYSESVTARACGDLDGLACKLEVAS